MSLKQLQSNHHPGGLIHLLSAPEGSLLWAAGMRQEVQTCMEGTEPDFDYAGHCLGLLLRSGGWRLLVDENADPFPSFIRFCYATRPHGLGLKRRHLESLLTD